MAEPKDAEFKCPKCGIRMKMSDIDMQLNAVCKDEKLRDGIMIAVTRPPMLAFGCRKCKISLAPVPQIEVPEKKIIVRR